MSKFEDKILAEANALLQGKTVEVVRAMTPAESKEMMWSKRAPVIQFTDGSLLVIQADDEGNDAGAALIQPPQGRSSLIPAFR